MKKKPGKRFKPLFFDILARIAIPLVILLFSFTFLLIRREFQIQQRHNLLEGERALELFHHEFTQMVEDPTVLASREAMSEQISWIKTRLKAEKIDVIDPILRRTILLKVGSEASSGWALSKERLENIQRSIDRVEQKNSPYYLVIHNKDKHIYGYLPFRDIQKNRRYVAVAQFTLGTVKSAVAGIMKIIVMTFALIIITAFFISFGLTLRIVRPLQVINRACREMLAGKLGHQVQVSTGDELELLAMNFNKMSQALLIMTHRAEDSNPLTQLPGNRQIAAELERRLSEGRKFVYFHLDIDHFKAYNDTYGLARGDEALRNTGRILSETSTEFENQEIFIGHQGGDDFVMITARSQADQIAAAVCRKFDADLKNFYKPEDLERGYFFGEDSRSQSVSVEAEIKRHPLMSISIAGVSNMKVSYTTVNDILEKAVIVKKRAKKIPYSVHLIEE